jgi:hypothetical protein
VSSLVQVCLCREAGAGKSLFVAWFRYVCVCVIRLVQVCFVNFIRVRDRAAGDLPRVMKLVQVSLCQ